MKKTLIPMIIAGAFVIILVVVLFINQSKNLPNGTPNMTTLFYSETCPHCKNVEAFIAENKIAENVTFDKKDAWDAKNSDTFLAVITACNIQKDQAGIPLVWDNGKCYMGEPDVMSFFKQKAGIQ
jgi:glutaredoxin-related protein